MIKKYNNLFLIFSSCIFFLINCFLKYPHINRDGLLYIDNALKFSGDYTKFYELYGLPIYSVILYYVNIFFNNFSFSSYLINFISYFILILYIFKITSLFHVVKNNLILTSTLLVFGISSLMSNYLGLTIRDYLGWSLLIMSFYYILAYVVFNKNKFLVMFIISILSASLFRIEYIFFLPSILIYYYFGNNHPKKNINIFIFLILVVLSICLYSLITKRTTEFFYHFNFFYSNLRDLSFSYIFDNLMIVVGKLLSLLLPFFVLMLCVDYSKFKNNSILKEYFKILFIYSSLLILINYIYLINTKISSARYFIPILLFLMPLFSLGLLNIFINKNNHKRVALLGLFISVALVININKNYHYKNTSILDLKTFIERENIELNEIFIEDNRLRFYMGKFALNHNSFDLSYFCNSDLNYYFLTIDQYKLVKDLRNISLIRDPLIHQKYKLIKKIDDCKNN